MRRKADKVVLIKGAGEVASGVACRLFRCSFRVVLLELPEPRAIRRRASFADAVYEGKAVVEGIPAYHCGTAHEARSMAERGGSIPVLVDPEARTSPAFSAIALVDARMLGSGEGTSVDEAPLVIGLGEGFTCGEHAHRVVETAFGDRLGRVLVQGSAAPDPDRLASQLFGGEPLVWSPAAGAVKYSRQIGDLVEPDEVLCSVGGAEARSQVGGQVTGLIREGILVEPGWRVALVDPRGTQADPTEIGFRPLAIAGGVLEAILSSITGRVRL